MNDMTLEIRALLAAATRLAQAAQRSYRDALPEHHAAICTLVERGGGQVYVRVTLNPAPELEIGVKREGQEHAFFSWPGGTGVRPN